MYSGTVLNSDADHVARIRAGIEKCGGHCPCIPRHCHTDDTVCPCREYRETGHCHCQMYVPENKQKENEFIFDVGFSIRGNYPDADSIPYEDLIHALTNRVVSLITHRDPDAFGFVDETIS